MRLRRQGREQYDLTITTDPPVTAWEASFDGGETYKTAEVVAAPSALALRVRWLIAGPDAAVGSAVAQLSGSVRPLVRATADPEIVVRDAPRIDLI